MKGPKRYWTKESCKIAASKCKRRTEFQKRFQVAYKHSCKNGWLDEICAHMEKLREPRGYWTKTRCHSKALLCSSRSDFKSKFPSAHNAALTNEWLDDICEHMKILKRRHTLRKCRIVALECRTRNEFKKRFYPEYDWCRRYELLDKVCSHMDVVGSRTERLIYAAVFKKSRKVYIGLTHDLEERKEEHLSGEGETSVFKYIMKSGEKPVFKVACNYTNEQEASWLEGEVLRKYKKAGYGILNKTKTGCLGGGVKKWTYEACKAAATKCKTKKEFNTRFKSAYGSALRNGWLRDISKHLTSAIKPHGYWTFERCRFEALKYTFRNDFKKGAYSAYCAAQGKGWLVDICSHMKYQDNNRWRSMSNNS